jgi:hypothetical protein
MVALALAAEHLHLANRKFYFHMTLQTVRCGEYALQGGMLSAAECSMEYRSGQICAGAYCLPLHYPTSEVGVSLYPLLNQFRLVPM